LKPKELCEVLLPTLDKLMHQNPELTPFRAPVGQNSLGFTDYSINVKKSKDLDTIYMKLKKGEYSDPWEYIDDVWLVFNNSWLFNQKMFEVFHWCSSHYNFIQNSSCDETKNSSSKFSEVFEKEIDPVMQALGYCCGRRYTFNPQVLCCFGKQLCTIPRDAKYFIYLNR
jgi:E1A/CREB-binding protein